MQECFRDITQHILSVWSFLPHKFFSCRQLPAQRDPSARNLCQTMWRCVLSRCFTVTLTANPHLRARAGSHRASSQASFMPTPPLRLSCRIRPGLQTVSHPPTWIARLLLAALNGRRRCRFQVRFFLLAFLSVALTASPKIPARPLVAPSEEHFHGGGLAAPLFREGRRTEDAQQSRKKKTMKTNTKKQNRAREQIRTVEQQQTHRQRRAQLRQWRRKTIACRLTPRRGRKTAPCPPPKFWSF